MVFYTGETKSEFPASGPVNATVHGVDIVIDKFSLYGSPIGMYSVVAGVGRNGTHKFLVGRGLADGMYQDGPRIVCFVGREIPHWYEEKVRKVLNDYRLETDGVRDCEVVLWHELILHDNSGK